MTFPGVGKTFYIAKETTQGTRVEPDKYIGVVTDVVDNMSREVNEKLGLGGIAAVSITSGMVSCGQTVTMDFTNGRMLEFGVGSVSHAETTGDWVHTFAVDNEPPSFTGGSYNTLGGSTVGLEMLGSLIESLEISSSINENVVMSFTSKAMEPQGQTTLPSVSSDGLSLFPHALVGVTINTVAATEVQTISIKFNKVVEQSGGLGSNLWVQSHATEFRVEVTATLGFSTVQYQSLFLLGANTGNSVASTADPTKYEISFDADNGVTLGSGQQRLFIEIENIINPDFSETASVGGLTFIDLTCVGTLKTCQSVDDISSSNW